MPKIGELAKVYLLLTGRLAVGRRSRSDTSTPLKLRELNGLEKRLADLGHSVLELTASGSDELLNELGERWDVSRMRGLLRRGMKMSLAIEKWQRRAIWVLCRDDEEYPKLFKDRMGVSAPPIIYGCGDIDLFDTEGIAIVGSRRADRGSLEFARTAGHQAAEFGFAVVSGGAKGVDQAAMSGVVDADGRTIGVLPNGLSRAAIAPENRILISDDRLLLISPFDPDTGFNVGNAMGRNKLIFALSNAGLVVESDHEKGGTWAGVTEQLKRLKFVPMFVRATGTPSRGLDELGDLGALPWPDPRDAKATASVFDQIRSGAYERTLTARCPRTDKTPAGQVAMVFDSGETFGHSDGPPPQPIVDVSLSHAERLFEAVRPILLDVLLEPKDLRQIAEDLDTAKGQTSNWLKRLVEERKVRKLKKPTRYVAAEP